MTPLDGRRGLYAITDTALCAAAGVDAAVAAAIAGGACLVQYRDKRTGTPPERTGEAAAVLAECRRRRVPLVINDDAELCAAIGADGVHIGRDDGGLAAARERLGAQAIIGVSCYDDPERAFEAQEAGAGYVAFGSFFASPTKPGAVRASTTMLAAARPRLRVPVAAIGGITPDNAPELIAAGADLLAVISGVFAQPDVSAAARAYSRLFEAHTPRNPT